MIPGSLRRAAGRVVAAVPLVAFPAVAAPPPGAVVGRLPDINGLNVPIVVPPRTRPLVRLDAGPQHVVAIDDRGELLAWGRNDHGQCDVPPGPFVASAAGSWHSLGLRPDGSIEAWGLNDVGQCDVPAGAFAQVAAGRRSSAAIRTNGALACWGDVCGAGDPPSGVFTKVVGFFDHFAALRADGQVRCWGANGSGQADPPPGTFIDVAVGSNWSGAIRTDGSIAIWGADASGIGDPPPGPFVALRASAHRAFAFRADGSMETWGTTGVPESSFMPPESVHLSSIDAGWDCLFGIDESGAPHAYGDGRAATGAVPFGRAVDVGVCSNVATILWEDGSASWWFLFPASATAEVGIGHLPGPYLRVQPTNEWLAALRADGTAACLALAAEEMPCGLAVPAGAFVDLAVGFDHAVLLDPNGALACFGGNDQQQCEPPDGTFTAISAGAKWALALDDAGEIRTWGFDLGDIPPPPGPIVAADAGSTIGFARAADGTFHRFGDLIEQVVPDGIDGMPFAGTFRVMIHQPSGAIWWSSPASCGPAPVPAFERFEPGYNGGCDRFLGIAGADCDDDGRLDAWQIAQGLLEDCNADGVPDLCQSLPPDACACAADLDADGVVGLGDLVALLAAWGPCAPCPADLDGDGAVGLADLVMLLAAWGPCAG